MNEEASQREQEEYAQFEAEQEELCEIACAKYEDYKPLLDEMIDNAVAVSHIEILEYCVENKYKLEKFISESEWQSAIEFMDKLLEV
ncbi:MAG: hypothetical protein LKF39_05360 [Lactococcus raffinolactis]|jgi:hypothetical protein|nr:hypothetical protein [Lactococcus raffinolactis]